LSLEIQLPYHSAILFDIKDSDGRLEKLLTAILFYIQLEQVLRLTLIIYFSFKSSILTCLYVCCM